MKLKFRQRSSTWEEIEAKGDAEFAVGRFAEARDAFRGAAEAGNGKIPAFRLAHIRRMSGESLRELADFDAAFAECDGAHDLISTLPDAFPGAEVERVRVLISGGRVLTESGRLAEAEELLAEAMKSADPEVTVEGALAMRSMADLRSMQAKYLDAADMYERAFLAFERLAPERDRERCRAANGRGLSSMYLNHLEEAETRLRDALDCRRRALAPTHPDIGESLHNLASVVQRRGRLDEAETLERSALALWQQSLGGAHPRLAVALGNLGAICQKRGRYAEAEGLYRQTLAIREAAFGERHPRLIPSINNIASIAQLMGRYDEAERLFRRSLELAISAKGEQHPDVARARNNLYAVLSSRGRSEEAEESLRHAIAIWEETGLESKELATALSNLGALLMRRNENDSAEEALLRSLAILQRILGPDHAELATALNNLATLAARRGNLERAESMYLRAEELREKAGFAHSPETIVNLGEIARRQGRLAEARDRIQEAIDRVEGSSGKDAPALPRYFRSLASVLRSLGDLRSCAEAYRRSLAIAGRIGAANPLDQAATFVGLGSVLNAAGEPDDAESAYRAAIALLEPAMENPADLLLAETLVLLGALLVRTGRVGEAEPLLVRGQDLAAKLLGDTHAVVRSASVWRGYAAITRGDIDAAEAFLLTAFEPEAGPSDGDENNEILALYGLRRVYGEADRPALRAGVLERIVERRAAQGVPDSRIAAVLWELATLRFEEEQYAVAAALYRRVQDADGAILNPVFKACTAYFLATCLWRLGDDGAEQQFSRAETLFADASGPDGTGVLQCRATWVSYLVARGHLDEARSMAAETERLAALPLMPASTSAHAYGSLGMMYAACEDFTAAESAFRRSIAAWERVNAEGAPANAAATREMLERLLKLKAEHH